jgi:fatty-acyl-CoA synthase
VARDPERPCVVAGDRRLSYGEVSREADGLAAGLADLGIESGDTIAVILPNRPEWLTSTLAAAQLGAIVVPVNPGLGQHELTYQLRNSEASVVVAAESHGGRDFVELFDELIADLPDVQYLVAVGGGDFWYDDRVFPYRDLLSREARPVPPAGPRDADATLAVLYTSGTMGKPKGVRLSHRNVVATAAEVNVVLGLGPADVVLAAVPLFTIFGASVAVGALAGGATLVLDEWSGAETAVALMARERVTVCHGVPTMYHLLLREPGFTRNRLPSLRTGIVAGSPVAPDLVAAVRRTCDGADRVDDAAGRPAGAPADHGRTAAPRGGGRGRRSRNRRPARAGGGGGAGREGAERDGRVPPDAVRDAPLLHAAGVLPDR